MIRNTDDKELKYFQLFFSGGVADNTRWTKVQSDPMLIFLSGNRPLGANPNPLCQYSLWKETGYAENPHDFQQSVD